MLWEKRIDYDLTKDSKQKKKDHKSSKNSSVNKYSSMECTYCGQDGHFAIKCCKNPQEEIYKGKPVSSYVGIKHQLNDMGDADVEDFKQLK